MMTAITGYRINKKIVCQLCKAVRDKGGYMVRSGPAPGIYCSAQHAQVAADEKGGDK